MFSGSTEKSDMSENYPHLVMRHSWMPATVVTVELMKGKDDMLTLHIDSKILAVSGPCTAMSPRSSMNSKVTSLPALKNV